MTLAAQVAELEAKVARYETRPVRRRLGHPFWSTPIPTNAPVAATSSDYAARLAAQARLSQTSTPVRYAYGPPYNTTVSTARYSLCVYTMPADTPRVPVWSRADKAGLRAVYGAGVPMPDPALIPGGNIAPEGTDGSVIILCGTELWEMWQVGPVAATDPAGYAWRCQQGGYIADTTRHPGWWSGSAAFGGGLREGRVQGFDWGVSACGLSYLGGILTAEDWFGPDIRHPLLVGLPITGAGAASPTNLLPATRYDQMNFTYATNAAADVHRLPEGARFRLPIGFDIDGWVATHALPLAGVKGSTAATLRKVLVCLRDFGVIVSESAGVVGFAAEHEKVYGTPYHPYAADQRPMWGNFGQQLPWDVLEQIAPPTVDISSPRG